MLLSDLVSPMIRSASLIMWGIEMPLFASQFTKVWLMMDQSNIWSRFTQCLLCRGHMREAITHVRILIIAFLQNMKLLFCCNNASRIELKHSFREILVYSANFYWSTKWVTIILIYTTIIKQYQWNINTVLYHVHYKHLITNVIPNWKFLVFKQ